MKKHILVFICVICGVQLLFSQNSDRIPGQILVQIAPGTSIESLLAGAKRSLPNLRLERSIAPDWDIYLLGFQEKKENFDAVMDRVQHLPNVRFAQWNAAVEDRTTPNDPNFSQQTDMELIHAPETWDSSIGGVTPRGDTIVVAVLEKGFLSTHPDLAPNLWYNRAEIPGDGVDNDKNGYVDDYRGFDVRNGGDGQGTGGTHGTSVMGIIGAKGNNGKGVTGVNWNVKLMALSYVDSISEVIRAYEYVWKSRRLYNQTNGAQGAFVVATNASFGHDNWFPSFAPLWCAAYDSLGKEGVLSAGATSNGNNNVDEVGDLPSTCPSEYLIVVNNVYATSGNKTPATGTGKINVDLGAPGDGTFTTVNGTNNVGSYGGFTGTSAATPHVTGAIALLYSFECDLLSKDALTDPTACARRVRDYILDNTAPTPTLANVTVTGGRLDLELALNAVRRLCTGSIGPLKFLKVADKSDDLFDVYYQTPSTQPHTFRVFNMLGQLMYEEKLNPQEFSANRIEYDASSLPSGIYVMSLGRGDAIVSRKFRKIRG